MLLSIQALILVEEPFFNEPGFDKQAGQSEGQVNAARYNEKARLLSLRSAVVLARAPPQGFARHLRRHFASHGAALVAAVEAQCAFAPPPPGAAATAVSVEPVPAAAAAKGSKGAAAAAEEEEEEGPPSAGAPPPSVAGSSAAAVAPSAGFLLALRRMLPTLRAVFAP